MGKERTRATQLLTTLEPNITLMKPSPICQLAAISVSCVLSAVFHGRCVRAGITFSRFLGPLWSIYFNPTLVLIRTIYRTVEHFSTSQILANSPPN